jgi:hypothetical protein
MRFSAFMILKTRWSGASCPSSGECGSIKPHSTRDGSGADGAEEWPIEASRVRVHYVR